MTKLTVNEVADLLGCSSLPSEVDYRITECATKGVAAIVYFYEEPLPDSQTPVSYTHLTLPRRG